jgi:hypothetical protein
MAWVPAGAAAGVTVPGAAAAIALNVRSSSALRASSWRMSMVRCASAGVTVAAAGIAAAGGRAAAAAAAGAGPTAGADAEGGTPCAAAEGQPWKASEASKARQAVPARRIGLMRMRADRRPSAMVQKADA